MTTVTIPHDATLLDAVQQLHGCVVALAITAEQETIMQSVFVKPQNSTQMLSNGLLLKSLEEASETLNDLSEELKDTLTLFTTPACLCGSCPKQPA